MNDTFPNQLLARRMGVLTHEEAVAFIRSDSDVSRSEGLGPHSRIQLQHNERTVYATLYQVASGIIGPEEVGLSEYAWERLGLEGPAPINVLHAPPLASMTHVRSKMFGKELSAAGSAAIVEDVVAGKYSDIQLSAFVAASASPLLSLEETIGLTRAMVEAGKKLLWAEGPIFDKHCIGGLPGNRTTPIVVSIVTCFGLTMPKTSSRAITSPAGTADTMETLANVCLDLEAVRRVVDKVGGCFVWGDSVGLSPADVPIIRIEKALELDVDGLLVASILSKKIAAGATHIVIDAPVGPTAKMRTMSAAARLETLLKSVASAFGVEVRMIFTNGREPVGRGVGPALEANDVLAVLQGRDGELTDLRDRSCRLAGELLEMASICGPGEGASLALSALQDGRALKKFTEICMAQGGLRTPPSASFRRPCRAPHRGRVVSIDNRIVARAAKLAGAPEDKAAGLRMAVRLGDHVEQGDTLFTLFSSSAAQIAYALDYIADNPSVIGISR